MAMAHARRLQHGFTLTEAVVTLAVAGALGAVAWPGMQQLLAQVRAETTVTRLHSAVHYTRTVAVMNGTPAVLCPLNEAGRCNDDWSEGFAVFLDADRDATRDADEPLLRQFSGVEPGARLQFRAFRSSRFLRMLPNGQTDWQNGRLLYCPPEETGMGPVELVINVQGRARAVTGGAEAERCEA
jgi:prepilin-type N-terminal cleavage/methylation domain-containing protein